MERIVRSWLEPGLTTLTDDVLDRSPRPAPRDPTAPTVVGAEDRRHESNRQVRDRDRRRGGHCDRRLQPSRRHGRRARSAASHRRRQRRRAARLRSRRRPATIIDAGRYRWTSPAVDVTFVLPDGWTGREDGFLCQERGRTNRIRASSATFQAPIRGQQRLDGCMHGRAGADRRHRRRPHYCAERPGQHRRRRWRYRRGIRGRQTGRDQRNAGPGPVPVHSRRRRSDPDLGRSGRRGVPRVQSGRPCGRSTSSTSTGTASCSGAPSGRRQPRRTSKRSTPSSGPSSSRHRSQPRGGRRGRGTLEIVLRPRCGFPASLMPGICVRGRAEHRRVDGTRRAGAEDLVAS